MTGQSRFTPRFFIYSPTCVGINPVAQMTPLVNFTKNPNCSGVNDIGISAGACGGHILAHCVFGGERRVVRKCGTEGVDYWFTLSGGPARRRR